MNKKILYNVTVKVARDVVDDWYKWMQETHIPDVMNTGKFERYLMTKILGDDDRDGSTYAIQYICKNMEILLDYNKNEAPALQKEHTDRYGQNCLAFRTIMEVESEG